MQIPLPRSEAVPGFARRVRCRVRSTRKLHQLLRPVRWGERTSGGGQTVLCSLTVLGYARQVDSMAAAISHGSESARCSWSEPDGPEWLWSSEARLWKRRSLGPAMVVRRWLYQNLALALDCTARPDQAPGRPSMIARPRGAGARAGLAGGTLLLLLTASVYRAAMSTLTPNRLFEAVPLLGGFQFVKRSKAVASARSVGHHARLHRRAVHERMC